VVSFCCEVSFMENEEMKQLVYDWTKQSYAEKLFAGTSGNLSLYDRERDVMVITPTSIPYETIQPEDMTVMRLDGTVIEGKYRPSSEWRMHAIVYQKKEDVSAIVHTHSPYAAAFAAANERIPCILIEMVPFIGGDVPLAPFALPGTDAVGYGAAEAMKERNGCLLANHGVIAVGKDLDEAHIRAVYIEDAAKICALAKGIGNIVTMDEETIAQMKGR